MTLRPPRRGRPAGRLARGRVLAALAWAWVLWAQTRMSPPGLPVKDAWEIVETFATRAACEAARVVIQPPRPRSETEQRPTPRTRYVCYPDTLDPQATP